MVNMQKEVQKETENTFWVQIEKQKMKECALTLHNLAQAFSVDGKEEEDENRESKILHNKLKENRVLMAEHLKEMAKMMQQAAEEKITIYCLPTKQEKQLIKMLYVEGLVLEEFSILEKGNGRKEVLARVYQYPLLGKKKYYTAEEVGMFLSVFS